MLKKIYTPILFIILAPSLLLSCECTPQINSTFNELNKEININILAKLPPNITAATLALKQRTNGTMMQRDAFDKLISAEKERTALLEEWAFVLKQDVYVLKNK